MWCPASTRCFQRRENPCLDILQTQAVAKDRIRPVTLDSTRSHFTLFVSVRLVIWDQADTVWRNTRNAS